MPRLIKSPAARRDFLKLVSLAPLAWLSAPAARVVRKAAGAHLPNIIMLVFDAWSADHLQFQGYPRLTMPNLERFAENASVYHNHYSAGTFTIPGTSSLLTGLHPWSHRALELGFGGLARAHVDHQAFAVFADTHTTLGYAQNKYADILLYQAQQYIDHHLPAGAFNLERRFVYDLPLFRRDVRITFDSLETNGFQDSEGHSSSLFMNPLSRVLKQTLKDARARHLSAEYPLGLPDDTEQFLLDQVVDGAIETLRGLQEPAFAYLHFWPPHDAYAPERQFYNVFSTGWQPPEKPIHRLSWDKVPFTELRRAAQAYDEYIASWDAELGRLLDYLRDSGLLERSYVVITSDHGELNERGDRGHWTPLIFDPLVHVPLIISRPGQKGREDIHAFTSSVDVLPTLAHLAGKPVPAWAEGVLLPGFGGEADPERGVFSMDAKKNAAFAPLTKITLGLTKQHRRLVYYNYPGDQQFEFYDLQQDPQELNDLYPRQPSEALRMKDELLQKLSDVNSAFAREQ
ncbi:MAG: sulfatase [Bacteroidota bacterium]